MLTRHGGRRGDRPGHEPGRAIRPARGDARPDVRGRVRPMRDVGFTPQASARLARCGASCGRHWNTDRQSAGALADARGAVQRRVGMYAFYAMQPYLLELYGRSGSYAIAGLAAAIVAGTQIVGGYLVPLPRQGIPAPDVVPARRRRRQPAALALIGLVSSFGAALPCSRSGRGILRHHPGPAGLHQRPDPVRAARHRLLHGQPARLAGGVVSSRRSAGSPTPGATPPRTSSAPASSSLALPFILLARRERAASDPIGRGNSGLLLPGLAGC